MEKVLCILVAFVQTCGWDMFVNAKVSHLHTFACNLILVPGARAGLRRGALVLVAAAEVADRDSDQIHSLQALVIRWAGGGSRMLCFVGCRGALFLQAWRRLHSKAQRIR